MGTRAGFRFLFSVLLLTTIFSPALAKDRGALFKIPGPGVIEFPDAHAGEPYDFDLLSLLSQTGAMPLTWSATGLPGFLKFDSTGNRAFGSPTSGHAGVFNFKISVQDSDDTGEFNRSARIRVLAPPEWISDPIDLGIQNEDKPWSFDLKTVINDPNGGTLSFEAEGLPLWMAFNQATGILSGTPAASTSGSTMASSSRPLASGAQQTPMPLVK